MDATSTTETHPEESLPSHRIKVTEIKSSVDSFNGTSYKHIEVDFILGSADPTNIHDYDNKDGVVVPRQQRGTEQVEIHITVYTPGGELLPDDFQGDHAVDKLVLKHLCPGYIASDTPAPSDTTSGTQGTVSSVEAPSNTTH
jgi:hypothetical protein